MRLQIIESGYTVITDLGRSSGPAFGLPVNGALDQFAARVANVLAGNRQGAPLLELTAFDFVFTPDCRVLLAVTGSTASVTVDGFEHDQWQPIVVEAGQLVRIAQIRRGLRCYIAVFGSLEAPELLGSCAPDTVLGFGIRLSDGDQIELLRATPSLDNPVLGIPFLRLPVPIPAQPDSPVVEIVDGPDLDQFGGTDARLLEAPYTVGVQSNHVGLRLSGPMPVRQSCDEILSRGVPVGAVEAPAGDQLLVLHRGRGVTAGYPVLAVVTDSGLDLMAQLRPGDAMTFRKVTLAQATRSSRQRRAQIDQLGRAAVQAYGALGLFDNAGGDSRWSATTFTN